MGFYERRILPRLLDYGMRHRELTAHREALLGAATGRVLEIGIGSGLNLPFYRRDIDGVIGVDPSPELLAKAKRHASWVHFPVELTEGLAEDLPLDARSIDCAVMTWTLCSVANPARALAEIRRVLRPGGTLLFIEHGQSPEAGVRRWQERIDPLWRRVAGGCHLGRPVDRLIADAEFRFLELETGHLVRGPRPWTFHFRGLARP